MRITSALSLIIVCFVAGAPQGRATSICATNPNNLVANCGFETGDFTSWMLAGNDVPLSEGVLYGVEGVDPTDGISPNSGSFQTYVGDLVNNSLSLSQTFTTIPGGIYTVSWYLAQDTPVGTGYSNAFSAIFSGPPILGLTEVPVQGYTKYSYNLPANYSSSELELTLGNDLGEFLLDDVSVSFTGTYVPEPSTWMLVLAGALFLAGWRKCSVRRVS